MVFVLTLPPVPVPVPVPVPAANTLNLLLVKLLLEPIVFDDDAACYASAFACCSLAGSAESNPPASRGPAARPSLAAPAFNGKDHWVILGRISNSTIIFKFKFTDRIL